MQQANASDFDIDPAALDRWMSERLPDHRGPVSVRRFSGGQSNPTYRISTARRDYALRRKPPGKLLPGAHAIEREYRVIRALAETEVPVPDAHALCEDAEVIGSPFYLMDCVEGRIFWDPTLPDVPDAERPAYYTECCRVIAALHRVNIDHAGLGDYGPAGNFFERQIGRWRGQYEADESAGRVKSMDRLCEWLPGNIPDGDETTLVHGDYRLDNLIFHPVEPRILAVIDWELSTLGHPLADFTYDLMKYRMPQGLLTGMVGAELEALGIPTEADYVRDYCDRSGRDTIANLDFYLAFNLFRLAAIVHGIKGRLLRGNASSRQAAVLVAQLEPLADLGWQQALQAEASR